LITETHRLPPCTSEPLKKIILRQLHHLPVGNSHQEYASLCETFFLDLVDLLCLFTSVLRTVNFDAQADFTNVEVENEVSLCAAELPLGLHLTLLGESLIEDPSESIFRRSWAASHLSRES